MAGVGLRRKALFQSASQNNTSDRTAPPALQSITSKISLEQESDIGRNSLQKELHELRIKKLRKKLEDLSQDDWKYPTIESLLGLK